MPKDTRTDRIILVKLFIPIIPMVMVFARRLRYTMFIQQKAAPAIRQMFAMALLIQLESAITVENTQEQTEKVDVTEF